MNPRNMILSSWKKGADCRRVCLATYQDSRYLCGRVGTAGSQDLSGIGMGTPSDASDL
jgi:hypothetical protein